MPNTKYYTPLIPVRLHMNFIKGNTALDRESAHLLQLNTTKRGHRIPFNIIMISTLGTKFCRPTFCFPPIFDGMGVKDPEVGKFWGNKSKI